MQESDITNRFSFHPVQNPEQAALYEEMRAKALELALYYNSVVIGPRELALALTNLQEASMWAIAGVACNYKEES